MLEVAKFREDLLAAPKVRDAKYNYVKKNVFFVFFWLVRKKKIFLFFAQNFSKMHCSCFVTLQTVKKLQDHREADL